MRVRGDQEPPVLDRFILPDEDAPEGTREGHTQEHKWSETPAAQSTKGHEYG